MATRKEIEENNKLLREQNQLLKEGRIISEETLDDNRDFANILRDQTKQIQFQVSERNQLRSIGNSLNKIAQDSYNTTHEELADLKTSKTLLDYQKKVKKDILGLESLRGKIILKDKELQAEINKSIEDQILAGKKLNEQLKDQQDLTEKISKNLGVKTFGFIEDITKAIPGLRKFSKPFEDAAKATREAALHNATYKLHSKGINKLTDYNLKTGSGLTKQRLEQLKLTKITGQATGKDAAKLLRTYQASTSKVGVMKAGFKALGPAIKTALGPLGIVLIIVDAVKMIVDLFIAADANTTAIAKNLGISKANAEGIRKEFIKVAAESDNLLVNSKSLLEAQGQLTQAIGATTLSSQKLAENQVFLTKNLGIAGDKAASMQLMFNATGQEMNSVVDSTIEFANQQAKSNGYLISGQEIMREISNTSAEIAGYYGFNNKALAKAVITARQFGLTLLQTQNISKGLLDFESSISNELEAELLTGKELNFEKARMLALQGDSAGAAAEVLKQAQDLTDEQRKNPILMQSMAKAAGLSVEELNKAYLVEKNLKMSRKDYNDLLAKGSRLGKQELVERLGLQGASRAEIEKTLTAQEAFAAAMDKAKDSFTDLVSSGVIDDLISALPQLIEAIASFVGVDTLRENDRADLIKSTATNSSSDYTKMGISKKEYESLVEKATLNKGAFGLTSDFAFATNSGIQDARKKLRTLRAKTQDNNQTIDAEDFTIRTHPKDTLKFAGGTKFGEETNTLLKELISAVNKGGDIYMDGNKVGYSVALASNKTN